MHSLIVTPQGLPTAFHSTPMAALANLTHFPTCALVGASLCGAARWTKAKQLGGGALRVRGHPACKGEAESRGGGRRGLVVGSAVGAAVLVASVAAVAVAARAMATSGAGGREAAILATRRGMQLFAQGDVKGSVVEFDKTLELDPRQRPCAVINFAGFENGAQQFRDDVAVNPNDTEESVWCFLCEAQLHGTEEARKRFLEVGRDSRPEMRAAYELFRDGGDTKEVAFESCEFQRT